MDDRLSAEICLRDAWPAPETAECRGWVLRAGSGGYNRINSVWTGRFDGKLSAAIDAAETFYRSRGLRPRFQMLEIGQPTGLDEALTLRGYRRELACSNMVKAATGGASQVNVTLTPEPSSDWLGLYLGEQPPEKAAELPRILARLPGRRGFIVSRRKEQPAGVALVGRVGEDAAVDCVMTAAAFRRSGVGRSLMRAAEAWAAGEGVRRLVLSVVDDNAAAMGLYHGLGYRKLSAYHYRVAGA